MDELLDLVNENDEVVGEVWRSEAHNDPKIIHREVGVAIYNDKKEVLLQKRSLLKKNKPGWWTIACAGHVAKGNTPEQTAHKELKEELGFDTELRFVNKFLEKLHKETRFSWFFVGMYNSDKFVVQKEEVDEVKFFSKEDFLELEKTGLVEPFSGNWCREFWKNN